MIVWCHLKSKTGAKSEKKTNERAMRKSRKTRTASEKGDANTNVVWFLTLLSAYEELNTTNKSDELSSMIEQPNSSRVLINWLRIENDANCSQRD